MQHAEQSLRLSVRLFDAELSKVGLGEALARLGIGIFLLDALKRVVFCNPAAERLIGDGLKIANERLYACGPRERQAFDAAVASGIHPAPGDEGSPPQPVLIRREGSKRPLTLYVLPVSSHGAPLAASSGAAHFLTQTRAIVLAIDPQKDAPADPALVRDLLGVTLGEARVASLVGFGLTPRPAAQRLGIAEETARVVLKRVFSKAGVSRQSELALLLDRLVLR